jgi:type IV pilus assembly protein PilE
MLNNYLPKKYAAFTLIEMLLMVALIGILARFAIPSFQQFIIDAKMKEASQVALKNSQFMEKYYTLNGEYTNGSAWPTLPYPVSPESGTPLYRITLSPATYTANNDKEYRIQARPICGTIVASSGCVCIDQDNNVYLSQSKLCINSASDCTCTN